MAVAMVTGCGVGTDSVGRGVEGVEGVEGGDDDVDFGACVGTGKVVVAPGVVWVLGVGTDMGVVWA